MNLEPAPRQSKLIYLAIDAGLLITAFIIVYFAKNPYAPLPFVSTVVCVVLAAIVGLVPFLIDYAADSAEYVQQERSRVADQVQRLHAAGESLARAAAQIKAVEEAVHKTAHAAENLPYRMQEKLAEFNETLATKDTEERESLERELDELRAANTANLKVVAEKISKATAEWSTLETASRQHLSHAQNASTRLTEQLLTVLGQLDARIAALGQAVVKSVAPPPPSPATPIAAVEVPETETASVSETVPVEDTPVEISGEPKPKKPRSPRKPKPEETLAAMSETPAITEIDPNESEAAPNDDPANAPIAEAAASSDGATRLLVTAYIGIGNKLFIRGNGPGLSWDKGVPMQFVSIGKWGWASHDVTAPLSCKLYKNDETAALSGEVKVEPGKHIEFTALF